MENWIAEREHRKLEGSDRELVLRIKSELVDGESLEDAVFGTYLWDLYTMDRMNAVQEDGTMEKIEVKLIGENGNAFAVLGKVSRALKQAGMKKEAEAYMEEATAGDYNHLLQVTRDYVEIT